MGESTCRSSLLASALALNPWEKTKAVHICNPSPPTAGWEAKLLERAPDSQQLGVHTVLTEEQSLVPKSQIGQITNILNIRPERVRASALWVPALTSYTHTRVGKKKKDGSQRQRIGRKFMNQLAWSKIAKHQRERRCLKNKVEKRKNPFETCCLTSTYASQHTCTYIHTYVHT